MCNKHVLPFVHLKCKVLEWFQQLFAREALWSWEASAVTLMIYVCFFANRRWEPQGEQSIHQQHRPREEPAT